MTLFTFGLSSVFCTLRDLVRNHFNLPIYCHQLYICSCRSLSTTYGSDYLYSLPFDPSQQQQAENEVKDASHVYKKCHSQFTDTADYRRKGVNTWQNETGLYDNTEMKKTMFKPSNPIPERTV